VLAVRCALLPKPSVHLHLTPRGSRPPESLAESETGLPKSALPNTGLPISSAPVCQPPQSGPTQSGL